ncbi:MAG TPA: PQQ-binding-like beta-propeller repeat protein [Pyrinomonadaceae bacterium]|nr:PQQ-binding-like beta-propeller repeat protein [Pyrinomonadaceae bacterium]
MNRLLLSLICLIVCSIGVHAQNWPQFRGPAATGVVEGQPAAVTWDAAKSVNTRWKIEVPGLAHSSPVVWGNTVFISTAVTSGAKDETRFGLYGDVAPVKDDPKHTWKVYALDKQTGKILWERVAYEGLPKVKRHPKSTHADSTPATDGKHLVVLFGSHGLYTYDLKGKLLWKQDLGVLDAGWFYDADYQWEHGSSPVIYKDLVIVQADIQKDSFIAAYSLKNGKLVWKTPREEISSWGTPTIYEGKTRAELITNGSKAIRGYDPATGKELWRLTPNSEVTTPTPFVAHDLIFVTSGYAPIQPIYAIRPGATGDISLTDGKESNTFIAWSKKRGGPYMPTPVVYGDHLYTCSNQGVLTAYNAHTGERIYQERLGGKGGAFTASPVASDGKIYLSSEDGDVFVVKAGPKYELLATNPVGEVMMATPAISGGLLIVRGVKHLFAFGPADTTKAKVAKASN